MDRSCSFLRCGKLSVATLQDDKYCLAPFILACYRHLEQSPEFRPGFQETQRDAELRTRSLVELIDQATSVCLTTSDLTNQERGQLLDILHWANDRLLDRPS
ncbi:MAG: hypothetical protein WA211_11230 [Candidatus Acidiferrales bacterium]